jgi:hypothetical protein
LEKLPVDTSFLNRTKQEYRQKIWDAYCDLLSKSGLNHKSAIALGITPCTIYEWRNKYPEFEKQCKNALLVYADVVGEEVHRRAFDGFREETYEGGELTRIVTKSSDRFLEMLAKKTNPEYREGPSTLQQIGGVLLVNSPSKNEEDWIAQNDPRLAGAAPALLPPAPPSGGPAVPPAPSQSDEPDPEPGKD